MLIYFFRNILIFFYGIYIIEGCNDYLIIYKYGIELYEI